MQTLDVIVDEYNYSCADGCCNEYGIKITINGVELPYHNTDTSTIVPMVLEHLGFKVNLTSTHNGIEY
jgi:hypothetical protein